MPSFDHFNFIAPIYDRLIKPKPPMDLLEHLDLSSDSLVLDVGGGTGRIAQGLIEHAGHVLVADYSFKMATIASRKTNISAIVTPGENLPYFADTFDAVIMVDALHHVFDQKTCLTELFRVTKPGGRLVVEEPDIRTFFVKLIALAEKILGMRSHFLTGERIAGLLSDCCKESEIYRKEYTVWVVVKK
jgi:ubiquinone/menaquinone biosynthesis C-methylase UbiE